VRSGTCPKCGSNEILESVSMNTMGEGGPAGIIAFRLEETSGFMKKSTRVEVKAWVCGACGYTELYAAEPAKLAERWRAGDR
jgi:predicted nucleic-acid-binding Zn-ribbon protein